jgi:hypothetical protein
MDEKVEILQKVNVVKNVHLIFPMYKKENRQMNKAHVANSLEEGLTELLRFFLKNDKDKQIII